MVELPLPETEFNDILGSMQNLGIDVNGMIFHLKGYEGEDFEYESDFGLVKITRGL